MPGKKKLILVDGSSYLYRAFHAMPNLTNSAGQSTGAVYGITNMLKRLLTDHDTEYVAVVFDAPGKTFRDDIYANYKANRPPMPDGLRSQIEYVHKVVKALGLPLIMIDKVEADDVIGTLAVQATDSGFETVISSGDKDLAQLVNTSVVMVDTMKDATYDKKGVEEKFGVGPDRIVDYLTLIGDSSDNIPGVPKVGPKTAVKWLAEFGTLDAIVDGAADIKGKVGENLRDSLEQIPLSRQLVTIKTDCDVELSAEQLKMSDPDEESLRQLYAELEFKTWLSELGGVEGGEAGDARVSLEYDTVMDEAGLQVWTERLSSADLFAFDTETTSLDPRDAQLVGFSFAVEERQAVYVPVGHDYDGAPAQLPVEQVVQHLKPLLEDINKYKVAQNLKYDRAVLKKYGINVSGRCFDTMLESYVLDSTASRHDMDSLSLKYLGHKTVKFEDIAGKGKTQKHFNEIELEVAAHYAAEDADITLRLHNVLWPRLQNQPSIKKVFEEIEMPLVAVIERIESYGVRIDADMLYRQSSELASRIDELEIATHNEAGMPFNISSPKQIQHILFEKMNLPVISKTPKGQPSTAENVLQELANDYELPRLILEHRGLSKLKSTYTDKLAEMVRSDTGRLHTSYHQAVAATGRLSSADPNLQNIPIRTAEGRRIREAFIADKGNVLIAADYSQIELRIMAHLSGDESLLEAFRNGLDVHRATAAEVFDRALEDVSDDQRRSAKAINFGLIYGMSAFGLARQLKIDRASAQQYVDMYFDRYPGVKAYMDETRSRAHDTGFVETVFGRRLYLPEINASNHQRRQYAERTAINAPMQGTAADLIKMAMINVDRWVEDDALPLRMIMQVHDELVLEAPSDRAESLAAKVVELMRNVAQLSVPLEVDAGIGENWALAHP